MDIGELKSPINCAINSSLDGSFDIASISSTVTSFPSSNAPLIFKSSLSFADLTNTFAVAAESLSQKAIAVEPTNSSFN